MKTRQEQGLTN